MMKPKRKKVVRQTLENILAKKERRIQALAEDAWKIREALKALDKQEKTHALHQSTGETTVGESNGTNQDPRQLELPFNPSSEEILEEQPTELPGN